MASRPSTTPTSAARIRRDRRAARGPAATTTRPSTGMPDERAEGQPVELVRGDQGEPDEQDATRCAAQRRRSRSAPYAPGSRHGELQRPASTRAAPAPRGAATATTPRGRTTRRAGPARPRAATVDHRRGRTSAAATVEHDALDRGDDLAPVARRRRLAQPGQQPAGRDERVARRADREHPRPAERATYTLSTRIRNASTSMSKRAPSGETVPVRRATQPSTASRTSATTASATSATTGAGR